jgi:hypothetical protein
MNRLAKIARRIGAIAVLAALTLIFAAPAFASGSTLDFTSQSDGKTNIPIDNVGIKLLFTEDVTGAAVWDANKNGFTLKDANGVRIPVTALPGQKANEENYILVLAEPEPVKAGYPGQLEQKTGYELTISGDITSVSGNRLGEDRAIKFTTMDVAANSKLSMVVMVLMMVAVIGLMVVTNTRKMKAEAEAMALMKANPYRIAKERSITVDEAKVLIEKAKEKNQKQLEKVGGKAPTPEPPKGAAPRLESKAKKKKPAHKVQGPHSALAAGSKFAAQHKIEAERKRKAAAAKKAARARQQQGGGSGSGTRKSPSSKGKKK